MLFQYPLESLARRKSALSQLEFARTAVALLRDDGDAIFEVHDHGLVILLANEEALERPLAVLRQAYGDGVEVSPPRIRAIPAFPRHEPLMRVCIVAAPEDEQAIASELRRREVPLVARSRDRSVVVLRAEGWMRSLVGLPARLRAIGGGRAKCTITLARYALRADAHPPA